MASTHTCGVALKSYLLLENYAGNKVAFCFSVKVVVKVFTATKYDATTVYRPSTLTDYQDFTLETSLQGQNGKK